MATFTLPAQSRSSGTLRVPAGGVVVPSNARTAMLSYVMPNDAERASTAAGLDFSIDISTNAGATWKPYLMASWAGGSGHLGKNSTVLNPPPGATVGGEFFEAFAGDLVSINSHLLSSMTIGLTVTVL